MRYSIKEKRRFHFRLTSTARLTKSEPVFQFRSLGLADDDFLGHRHFQVDGQPNFFPFFETDDIHEAKDFAMRLAFEEFNLVKVMDTKRQELVRDFDAAIYRE